MSAAIAERQAWAPQFAAALSQTELADMLDTMRTMMKEQAR